MASFLDQLKAQFAQLKEQMTKGKGDAKPKKAAKPQKPKKKKAIKITPMFIWDADIERESGNAEEALRIINMGKEKYPNADNLDLVLSAIYFELEKFEESLQACDSVLAKNPVCISALRRKGDIFDKQGNTVERNRCYRLVHDIDPMDAFWKDEYGEVPPEEVPYVDYVASAALPTDDLNFTDEFELPSEESSVLPNEENAEDNVFADLNSLEQSAEDSASDAESESTLENSLDSALDAAQSMPAIDTPATIEDESMSGNDVSSAIEDFFGDSSDEVVEEKPASPFSAFNVPSSIDDDESTSGGLFEKSAEEPAGVVEDKPTTIDDAFGDLLGEDELPEEAPATSAFEKSAEEPAEVVEDKPTTIDDAFGDLLGEDELPEEAPATSAFEKSAEEPAEVVEDKPTTIDDAFGDLLGEDELPEEAPATSAFEKSAEEPAEVVEDKPTTIDDAFGDLLGEDELPEEAPATSAFEKSAEEPQEAEDIPFAVPGPAMELDDETPKESLASLLGDVKTTEASIDLDEETSGESLADILGHLDAATTQTTEILAENVGTENLSDGIDDAFGSMFGEDELPEESASVESETSEEVSVDDVASDKTLTNDVGDAFGDLLGDDELPEEKPQEAIVAEEIPDDTEEKLDFSFDKSFDELVSKEESIEAPVDVVAEDNALQNDVGDALGSMFGEDELPEENTSTVVDSKLNEVPDDADESLDFTFDKSSDVSVETEKTEEVVAPADSDSISSETKDDVDGAFASLFGDDDDDLELPPPTTSMPAVSEIPQETKLNDVEVSQDLRNDLDSSFEDLFGKESDDDLAMPSSEDAVLPPLSSEASLPEEKTGAFDSLFNLDDDLPEEKTAPQDGVDFLMSGDSDDEVTSALLKDPKESLIENADKIDDSLNTRTLAEIYFEQGLYQKSLDIYKDLAEKQPDDQKILERLAEIQKVYNEKFGGN